MSWRSNSLSWTSNAPKLPNASDFRASKSPSRRSITPPLRLASRNSAVYTSARMGLTSCLRRCHRSRPGMGTVPSSNRNPANSRPSMGPVSSNSNAVRSRPNMGTVWSNTGRPPQIPPLRSGSAMPPYQPQPAQQSRPPAPLHSYHYGTPGTLGGRQAGDGYQ